MTQIKTWILLSALSGGRLSLRQQCDSLSWDGTFAPCAWWIIFMVSENTGVRSQMVNVCFTRCEHFNVLSSICASRTDSDQNKLNTQRKGLILNSGGSWMILTLQHMYNRTCSINRSSFFTTIRLHSTEVDIYLKFIINLWCVVFILIIGAIFVSLFLNWLWSLVWFWPAAELCNHVLKNAVQIKFIIKISCCSFSNHQMSLCCRVSSAYQQISSGKLV